MALVNVLSIGIVDHIGNRKTLPVYVDATLSLANVITLMDTLVADLDAAIDGVIQDASVQLALTLPGGLKTTALVTTEATTGSLLTYDPANTNYAYSAFVPTWSEAGFAGQAVVNTGVYATLIDDFVSLSVTDRNGNNLDSFTIGTRRVRK